MYGFLAVVLIFILTNIVWAWWRNRDITFSTYVSEANQYSWAFLAASVSGTIVGGGMFLAVGQIGYEAGLLGYFIGIIYLVGFCLIAVFSTVARDILNANNSPTLIDLIADIYGKRTAAQFSVISGLIYLILLSSQFLGVFVLAKFIIDAGFANSWMIWVVVGLGILAAFLYPVVGGLRKDIQTDVLQLAVMAAAVVFIGWLVGPQLAARGFWAALQPEQITGTGYGSLFLIGVIVLLTPSFFVRMDIWQRIRAARSDRDCKLAFVIAGLVSLTFYVIFTSVGMLASVKGAPNASLATPYLIFNAFGNELILGLIVGSFFAAVLSSADTFINNVSIFFSRLFFPTDWASAKSGKGGANVLKRMRFTALVATALAVLLAIVVSDLVDLLVGAFSLLLIYIPMVAGLFIKSWRNEKAVFWSTNVGILAFFLLFFFWEPKLAIGPAVLMSIAIFVILRLWIFRGAWAAS